MCIRDSEQRAQALARQADVLLVTGARNAARPIAVALLDAEAPHVDMVLDSEPTATPPSSQETSSPLEVLVDGKPIAIEASDQLVLRCGESSITLHANGRVVIKGNEIESHARGTNRIKGGAVRVN